jgi:hypothetical protein
MRYKLWVDGFGSFEQMRRERANYGSYYENVGEALLWYK